MATAIGTQLVSDPAITFGLRPLVIMGARVPGHLFFMSKFIGWLAGGWVILGDSGT
jgi:hypothetical protein